MTEPTAELPPLAYYHQTSESWWPVVRLMAMAAIAQGGIELLGFGTDIFIAGHYRISRSAFFFGISFLDDVLTFAMEGIVLLSAAMLISGGILALYHHRVARKWIIVAAVVSICISSSMILLLLVASLRRFTFPGYFARQLFSSLRTCLQDCVVPMLLWYFFRRAEVKNIFGEQ